MAYGTVNADVIQSSVSGVSLGAGNATNFKNRIINGAMMIDQRNAGASVTPTNGQYTVDRWQANLTQASKFTVQQNAGSVTPPVGFSNYLGVTSSSAYSVVSGDFFNILQKVEGFNSADLGWGTANAKTVTLSFWVYSSLTGTFGGAISNSALSYTYPFSYTVSSANTWTQITLTIAGPTSGTWIGATNGIGLWVIFGLGAGSTYSGGTAGTWAANGTYINQPTSTVSVVGTNGATWYITGVQLEVGSSATGFEYRDYGRELMMCQRYYQTTYSIGTAVGTGTVSGAIYRTLDGTQSYASLGWAMPVRMRTTPTVTYYGPFTGTAGKMGYNPGSVEINTGSAGNESTSWVSTLPNGVSISTSYGIYVHFGCSAEL